MRERNIDRMRDRKRDTWGDRKRQTEIERGPAIWVHTLGEINKLQTRFTERRVK